MKTLEEIKLIVKESGQNFSNPVLGQMYVNYQLFKELIDVIEKNHKDSAEMIEKNHKELIDIIKNNGKNNI